MFEKLLVANRGEIAVRVIRACKELNIRTVAVYSEADSNSMHAQMADEAICIGGAPSAESYLRIDRIIGAAEISDVDAIHPGYGFLSENAHFAEVCENCNIRFIGPKSDAMNALEDKALSRELARKAGVPIPPGSKDVVETEQEALKTAKEIGYPVMIKAAAGGGGIGIQVVNSPDEFEAALRLCQGRALSAFGDDRVFVEKFIEGAQHIEFQILADGSKAVHFGERFCSIQRRHQKIIEEGPWLSEEVREELGAKVVAGAEAVGYEGLATFEFLRDSEGEFYFLEVNPRVQVEHTVTEMIAGVDLISLGIRVAAGESLPLSQDDVKLSGHAIQVRINAENPFTLEPSPGRIWECHWPGGPGVRVDTHAHTGYDMPPSFDSLLAKLIVWAPTREEAIAKMDAALGETLIIGVDTLIPLHRAILNETDFRNREVNVGYLDGHQGLLDGR